MDLRNSLAFGVLLSAPLSMLVVAGTLGLRMALLDKHANDTLVLTALFASVLYPLVFRRLAASPGQGPTGDKEQSRHEGD